MTSPNDTPAPEAIDGLICAFRLNGSGGGTKLNWDELDSWQKDGNPVWAHLDYESDATQKWLSEKSQLDELVRKALLAPDPRPRSFVHGDGLMVILRGVNMNPGAEPDDMVSLRIWLEPGRIVTLRHRRLMAVNDIREAIEIQQGPKTLDDFLVQLVERILSRMEESIGNLEECVDELEESVIDQQQSSLRSEIARQRRMAIGLRRYIAPQRQAMTKLMSENVEWFSDLTRAHLREFADRLTRYVEDLDSARERASVTQDEVDSRASERMNRTMYLISVYTAIFLPLGLITGLLGINVGGMPGVESDAAFWTVCGLMVLISVLLIAVLKARKWF